MKYMPLALGFLTAYLVASFAIKKEPSWKTIKTNGKPVARHENAFVECEGKFYLIGGREIKPVNIYDPQTNTWTNGAESPIEIHHFQAVSYHGKLIAAGAMTGPYPNEVPVSNLYVYDTSYDLWTIGPEIPERRRRGSSGAVIYNNKLYLICGIADGHNGDHKNWTDAYDFETRSWKILQNSPRARDHFQAVLAKDKIYVFGGRNTSKESNHVYDLTMSAVDVYDIASDSWSTLEKEIHIERAGASVVLLKNEIFIIGGESRFSEKAHNEIEIYNLKLNKWMPIKYLQQGRHGTQALVYKNRIYIAAGCSNRGGTSELSSLEVYSKKN